MHNKLSCVLSSCEDLLPMDVSHALMEVLREQLQNILYTFQQQQTAERLTAEGADLDFCSKSAKPIGALNSFFKYGNICTSFYKLHWIMKSVLFQDQWCFCEALLSIVLLLFVSF